MPRKRTTPRKRRVKGTGSIFPDKRRGGWQAKLPAGRKPNGKLKYKWFHAGTAEEVARLMADAKPPAASITLAAWSARWLLSLDVRQQSRDNYDDYLRLRILPSLGTLPVASITTFHIEEAMRQWKVGAMTARHTLAALSACLQAAVRAEVINRNPARFVKKPRVEPPPRDPFTPAELRRIILAALEDRRYLPFALCAATGARIGEALALRPEDYHPLTGKLSIERTMTRLRTVGPPKSRHSRRSIIVPPIARDAAQRLPFDTNRHRTMNNRWVVFLKRLGLRYRELHQLRHSVATHMLAAGVPIADAAAYLGDTVAVLVKTYVHPTGADVAGAIQGLLGGDKVAPRGEKDGQAKRNRRK